MLAKERQVKQAKMLLTSIPECDCCTGDKVASSKLPYPAAQSDAVAEAILECCVLLMQRCPVQSGEQLCDLLEHFVTVVNLGKASATEEVHLLYFSHAAV